MDYLIDCQMVGFLGLSLAAWGTIATIAGAGYSAYSGVQQAKQSKKQAEYDAEYQAQAAEAETEAARQEAVQKQTELRREHRQRISAIRSAQAKGGVLLDTGTAADVQEEQVRSQARSEGDIIQRIMNQQRSQTHTAASARSRAKLIGKQAKSAAWQNVAGQTLGAVGTFAKYKADKKKGN